MKKCTRCNEFVSLGNARSSRAGYRLCLTCLARRDLLGERDLLEERARISEVTPLQSNANMGDVLSLIGWLIFVSVDLAALVLVIWALQGLGVV